MKKPFTLLMIIPVLLPMTATAEDNIRFSLNSWVSQGQTKWRHDASAGDARLGVPTSELDYQNVDSNVLEVGVVATTNTGHVIRLALGSGDIDSGLLVDDDYLSAYGATYYGASQSGNHRYSRTHSDIHGNGLLYLNGRFSPQDFSVVTGRLDMRFSFAAQYWEEEYNARGVRQIECTTAAKCNPAGYSGYANVTVISNVVQWTGFGVSLDGSLQLFGNLSFTLDATYYPIVSLNNEDTHHLRTDLAQNPSVRMTGTGSGYDLTAALRMQLAEELSVHLGYRVWERHVSNQIITFYGANGGVGSADLLDFKTRRDGFIAGVSFRFR